MVKMTRRALGEWAHLQMGGEPKPDYTPKICKPVIHGVWVWNYTTQEWVLAKCPTEHLEVAWKLLPIISKMRKNSRVPLHQCPAYAFESGFTRARLYAYPAEDVALYICSCIFLVVEGDTIQLIEPDAS